MANISRTKWGIWVNHLDGTRSFFSAPTLLLAQREGARYLAHPAAASVDIGPWEGPASAITYHRTKNDARWQNRGHQGRIAAAGIKVKVRF